jgi:ABC-type phosphate/phosphonate transport system substrate-binding protein
MKQTLWKAALAGFAGILTTVPATAEVKSANARITVAAAEAKKTAYAPPAATAPTAGAQADVIVFSAAPRESEESARELYDPVAKYLSQVIGKRVVFQYPGTWGVYRAEMLKGTYDLVFDGPHFNSYRSERLNHNVLVKMPEVHEFVVISKKETKFNSLSQMAGRSFCTHAPPNLGTLILLSQFENPARQPLIVNTNGWDKIFEGVASGRCSAGVLPLLNLKKLDKTAQMKVLHRAQPMPNQAFSAGPRITPEDQARIAQALLAPEAAVPTARMREAFKSASNLVATSNQEYTGLGNYLRSEWGYY